MEDKTRNDTPESNPQMEPGDPSAEHIMAAFDYRTFANMLPEMVFVTDPRGRAIFFNRHWHDYTGIPAGPEMRTRAWEAAYPEDRPVLLAAWEAARAGEQDLEAEFRLRGADGDYRWILTRAFVHRDPATGALLGWVGFGTDIDALKRAQEERDTSEARARLSEERLRFALEAARFGAWESDIQGVREYWSKQTGVILGRPELSGEVPGTLWRSLLHPDDRERVLRRFQEAVTSSREYDIEYRIRSADGEATRWIAAHGMVICDETETPVRVIGLCRDITREKQTLIALRQSEERYRALVDASSQIIWTNTAEGEMRGPQPGWSAFTGQTTAEYQGYGWTGAVHPDDVQPTIYAWNESVRSRSPFHFEHRLRRYDGVWRLFRIRAVPVQEDGGVVREWVGIHTDITEERETERRREQMEAQRDALLQHVEEAAEKQRRFLREILSSMSEGRLRLCETVADLPDPLCREPAAAPVTLDRMTIRNLRKQTTAACDAAGLPMERESDLVTAVGEAAMNAVVHAGSGTGTVYGDSERGIVQVWIHDTGTGISEESLHRATLEKGYTTAGTLGHGFWMMLKTADRVYLLTGASGTTVVIEQERQPPVPLWMQTFVDAY